LHAHIHPVVFEVRIYGSEDGGFERQEPYVAVCNARLVGDGEYFISMMHGSFGHNAMTVVMEEARKLGARKLWFERRGKLKSILLTTNTTT